MSSPGERGGEVEIHFDQESGALHLTCDMDEFVRLRALVFGVEHLREVIPETEVRTIEIEATGWPPRPPSMSGRLKTIGCVFAGLFYLLVFVVGIRQIVRWITGQ